MEDPEEIKALQREVINAERNLMYLLTALMGTAGLSLLFYSHFGIDPIGILSGLANDPAGTIKYLLTNKFSFDGKEITYLIEAAMSEP